MIEPFYKLLGRNVAAWRKKRGLTQEEVGRLLSPPLKKATIARIEGGLQRLLTHFLVQIADVLGVSEADLLPEGGTRRLSGVAWRERTVERLRTVERKTARGELTPIGPKARLRAVERELAKKLGLPQAEARALAKKMTKSR